MLGDYSCKVFSDRHVGVDLRPDFARGCPCAKIALARDTALGVDHLCTVCFGDGYRVICRSAIDDDQLKAGILVVDRIECAQAAS